MANTTLQNPGWETGDTTGWDIEETTSGTGFVGVRAKDPYEGTYIYAIDGTSGSFTGEVTGLNKTQPEVSPGVEITAKMWLRRSGGAGKASSAKILLRWYDSAGDVISTSEGAVYTTSEVWIHGQVKAAAPAGTATVRAGFWMDAQQDGDMRVDLLTWDYVNDAEISLINPPDGATFSETDIIPLSVNITGTEPKPFSVTYKAGTTTIGSSATAPYTTNSPALAAGTYEITAEVTFDNLSVMTTAPHTITVAASPPAPITREFKASNAYAYLIAENFSGISAAIPSIARITAAEAVVDYNLELLVRSKDLNVADPEASNPNVLFDVTDGGTLQMAMVHNEGESYSKLGSSYSTAVPIDRPSFVVTEEGTSDGKKWTVFASDNASLTIGSDESLFGLADMATTDFANKGLAFRFVPNLLPKPSYADSGDGVIRFNIDKVRVRVYFDAGSVEYYFASPDKTHVIKGDLVAAQVLAGNLTTADASGVLQLAADLEVVDGIGVVIGCDYTIHAGYPVTDANQIGVVVCQDGRGMVYNDLPTQSQVRNNRSRYVMISANFYGDKNLNSIYGANGLSRGFALNKEFFYKIYTQPDAAKDQPRHVAEYHQHLALGYDDGRVDISVAGKPYNFSGLEGASSWATGDSVTGLLKLSGTILGVYGTKSITGISGTTVDNFATQTISAKLGATEYTVTDMGFPVHANAYGVYTLSQVQQYGDYMGTPMSADISPWLRPRLIRKITSNKEVVVAWPVRSKNQYRLAFSDGYVVSMTLNGQAVPTFSFQKYFWEGQGPEPYFSEDLYSYPSIVPAAVSSELDESGEERIHIAPYMDPAVEEAGA